MIIVNLAPGQISIRFGAKGPNLSQVSACSTGAHAIGDAFRVIQRGDADAMICGGTEATVTPLGVGGFNSMRALSTRNDAPEQASRPFDRDRDGFVIAEGAGIVVIEELEHAKRAARQDLRRAHGLRRQRRRAPHHGAGARRARGAQRCMKLALKDAKLSPADIGYINAHGTSTKMNDANETLAIKKVFGDAARKVMVSSTKSMTGHMLGAAGGVETAICALALARGVDPADHQLHDARSRVRPRLRAEHGARGAFFSARTSAARSPRTKGAPRCWCRSSTMPMPMTSCWPSALKSSYPPWMSSAHKSSWAKFYT